MNKEELVEAINRLPLFGTKDVAVKDSNAVYDKDGNLLNPTEAKEEWQEKEKWKSVTEITNTEPICFVSNKYVVVQFKEMFNPIVEQIGECKGDLMYFHGFGIMDIFPAQDEYKINGDRIGIVAYNSVDSTCALNIRFCIQHNDKYMTIPKRVASFRKVHMGKIQQMTQDYIAVIAQIKTSWNTILNKFTEHNVTLEDMPDVAKNFKLDDHVLKRMKKNIMSGTKYNLWDFCMEVFDYLSARHYKSDVHRRKRLDKFVQTIFDYGLIMDI